MCLRIQRNKHYEYGEEYANDSQSIDAQLCKFLFLND